MEVHQDSLRKVIDTILICCMLSISMVDDISRIFIVSFKIQIFQLPVRWATKSKKSLFKITVPTYFQIQLEGIWHMHIHI